jgi:O2-independent ubiquinone biosynthesis accessory factor UbiT
MSVRRPWAAPSASLPQRALTDAMIALRGPVELLLTRALRSLANRYPEAFRRLDAFQTATYRIAPTDFPVAFDLRPDGARGTIKVVRKRAPGNLVATLSGPLIDLLGLFDGSIDADAAFFSRTIQAEGDISAVMALHNALESAELKLSDLLPLPAGRHAADFVLDHLVRAARRRAAPAGG